MQPNAAFWRGKRVLLTGHTGFKGAWLSLWLQRLGAEVQGLALAPPDTPNLFTIAQVVTSMAEHTIGDIRDPVLVQTTMSKCKPEIVIHMAAQALVRLSYAEPAATYATNVLGTVHVLDSARHTPSVRAIVVVTSDKCYENKERPWGGYREDEPMGGHDPYSSSKGCAELVTSAYRNSFFQNSGIAVASARAGNVIGGGDWAEDRLIPDLMRAILQGHTVEIRNPNAIRPWQHVLDPLFGYLALAEKLYTEGSLYAESWNFGPNEEDAMPVLWIVERLAQLWGEGANWRLDDGDHPHEAQHLKLDCLKAKSRLNWRPRKQLDETLKGIVEWYKYYQQGENMQTVTLEQIAAYCTQMNRIE